MLIIVAFCAIYSFNLMQVGSYNESESFKTLAPLKEMELPKEVEEILRSVLRKDHKKRPSAIELLRNPVIEEGKCCLSSICS